MSPVLLIFFINYIFDNTTDDNDDLLTINEIICLSSCMQMMLYFSQNLHKICYTNYTDYSNEWGLKVNTDKTKIMIFEKGRKTDVHIYYNNVDLEVVDSFKYMYLGIMFYKNDSWNRTQECLAEYGSFALHNLYRLLQDMNLKTSEKFKLCNSRVGSVLGYAGEV